MGVSTGVDDDAVKGTLGLVNGVNDRTLMIGLHALHFHVHAGGGFADPGDQRIIAAFSIDFRFSGTKQVQIRTVDN